MDRVDNQFVTIWQETAALPLQQSLKNQKDARDKKMARKPVFWNLGRNFMHSKEFSIKCIETQTKSPAFWEELQPNTPVYHPMHILQPPQPTQNSFTSAQIHLAMYYSPFLLIMYLALVSRLSQTHCALPAHGTAWGKTATPAEAWPFPRLLSFTPN